MIEIQQFTGPFGIPILYQRMPEMVKSVAMSWVIFTGAADDESVGKPGLYHWFEHVPFRGTAKYPGGYAATKGWATKYAGHINARTGMQYTVYESSVPLEVWDEALSVITDLFGRPLIREDDVAAEREIIRQEIAGSLGKADYSAFTKLSEILYGGHPFGHRVLGTEETLDTMDVSTLCHAYKAGYDRSRAMLIIVGNIPIDEIQQKLANLAEVLPANGLSERRVPANRGFLPEWKSGKTTTVETEFVSSLVFMLFPLRKKDTVNTFLTTDIFSALFQFGGLSSPLYRIAREERKLVYKTFCVGKGTPARNYFGFCAETKMENIDAVLTAFRDVVNDPQVRSSARLEEIKQGTKHLFNMRPIDPEAFRDIALQRYLGANRIVNDSHYEQIMNEIERDQVEAQLNQLSPDKAHAVVFKGTGSKSVC